MYDHFLGRTRVFWGGKMTFHVFKATMACQLSDGMANKRSSAVKLEFILDTSYWLTGRIHVCVCHETYHM